MAIEGFDYKGFASSMAEQAVQLVPADLKDFEKEYIVKTLGNFTLLAGEALYNDTELNLTAEQAVLITQIIAEWSYHKSIDLIHSGILPQYWDTIMQKIAFTIFEVAKQAVDKKIPQDQLLQVVEHHVNNVYKQSIEELQQKGLIDEDTKVRAESQSNIDVMAQQAQAEQQKQQQQMAEESARQAEEKRQKRNEEREAKRQARKNNSKVPAVSSNTAIEGISNKDLKLMTLSLLLKILSQDKVTTILNKFSPEDSGAIAQYMDMADLEYRLNGDLVNDCLKEMKNFLPSKRKLTEENIMFALRDVYATNPRESVEKVIKNERPLVKRFMAKAYDGEFGELPLKVAGIVTEYVEDNLQQKR